MKRLVLLLIGCGGALPSPSPRPAPTEADACARVCDQMQACGVAPGKCEDTCLADQKRFRAGVQPAYTACVERELARCDSSSMPDRRQALSLCWSATVEAYARDDEAMRTIVRAICAQLARCNGESECEGPMMRDLAGSARSKTMAVVKPELVAATAACIEKTSCMDPISRCTDQ